MLTRFLLPHYPMPSLIATLPQTDVDIVEMLSPSCYYRRHAETFDHEYTSFQTT